MKLLCNLILLTSVFLFSSPSTYALDPIYKSASQSATVGTIGSFSLFGYTSPLAHVTLSSNETIASATADAEGYFFFRTITVSRDTREICIQSLDIEGLTSQPSCIAFTAVFYGYNVGPILLSPSLALDAGSVLVGKSIQITGRTVPNSLVTLSSFLDKNRIIASPFAKDSPFTRSLPKLEGKSDAKGHFSFGYGSMTPQTTRVYANARKESALTAKSTTLKLEVLPFWKELLLLLIRALKSLRFFLLPGIILLESLILIYLLLPMLLPRHAQTAITLYNSHLPNLVRNSLAKVKNSLLITRKSPVRS